MLQKLFTIAIFSLILSVSIIFASNDPKTNDRAADEKAIREHVEKIFKAFIDGDAETVRATHSTNWRGFLSSSNSVIKGIDGYMKSVNVRDPKNPNGMYDYKFLEYDTTFYGETGVVSYVAEIFFRNGETTNSQKYRSVDVYAKENGSWIQVASSFSGLPSEISKSLTTLRPLTPQQRQSLMKARDGVWEAFFANDTAKLEKILPKELVAINPGEEKFDNLNSILASAKAFAESGAKLVKIEFPVTEIQALGPVIIMYSNYIYELETKGEKKTYSGRATEIFIIKNNALENIGWHLDDGK